MQDIPFTFSYDAEALGFTLATSGPPERTQLEARHANGATVRTWLFKQASGQRLIQLDAPKGLNVCAAQRAELGVMGGKDATRCTAICAGLVAQERLWFKALQVAEAGQWGAYEVPTKAQRESAPDARTRRYALQLLAMLRELHDAATLECVTDEMLARCADLIETASPMA